MGSLKRNTISIVGWFIFASFYYALAYTFKYIVLQIHNRYSAFTITSSWAIVAIVLVVFFLGFLAFTLSMQVIVFPVAHWNNLSVKDSKYPIILEWLIFFVIFFIASWPLTLIEELIKLVTTAPIIIDAIKPIWQVLVSLWLYRENVLARLSTPNNQLEKMELKMPNSTLT